MLLYKRKSQSQSQSQSQAGTKGNNNNKRLLISVTVLGSAGPIRFVVKEEELVASVIDTSLKSYAREGRLPLLSSDLNDFFLYCPNALANSGALSPWETIGSLGARNFMLCRKTPAMKEADINNQRSAAAFSHKGSGIGSWKSWINKSLSLNIPSH